MTGLVCYNCACVFVQRSHSKAISSDPALLFLYHTAQPDVTDRFLFLVIKLPLFNADDPDILILSGPYIIDTDNQQTFRFRAFATTPPSIMSLGVFVALNTFSALKFHTSPPTQTRCSVLVHPSQGNHDSICLHTRPSREWSELFPDIRSTRARINSSLHP